MKVTCLQENLAKGISIVSRSVSARPQLPVLANILLSTDNGKLKLSSTNLEVGVNVWVGGKIEKEGAITVPARILSEFVTSLPKDKVLIEIEGSSLTVSSNETKASILGISATEFPPIASLTGDPDLVFEAASFSSIISQVAFAASTDEGRPALSGVLVVLGEKEDLFVATDGFRLSLVRQKTKRTKDQEKKESFEKRLILPAKTLIEVSRIIGGDSLGKAEVKGKGGEGATLQIKMDSSSNQVIFKFGDAEVVSRIIDGQFPNFEKVIPTTSTSKVVFDKEELLRIVKTASIFARDGANIIKFTVDPAKKMFKVTAGASSVGESESEIDSEVSGVENEIAFNARYLIEFLTSVSYARLVLETGGPLAPGLFKAVSDDSFLHIIMPVRVQQ